MSTTSKYISNKLKDYKKSPITSLFIRVSFFSVTLCVSIMILSAFLISGFAKEINEKMSILYGDLSIANRVNNSSNFNQGVLFSMSSEELNQISQSENVQKVSPQITSAALVKKDSRPIGLLLKASSFDGSSPENHLIRTGRLPKKSKKDNQYEICISENQSRKLNAKIGDDLISYFKADNSDQVIMRKMEIVGTYNSSIYENDDAVAWVDLSYPREILKIDPNEYSTVLIDLKNPKKLEETQNNIWDNYLQNPLSIESISDRYAHITDWIQLQQTNEVIILLIMFFIALITMISCILILILDKLSLIGVLQTLGARNRTIQQVFLDLSQKIILRGIIWGNIIAIVLALLQQKFRFLKLDEKYYMLSYVPINIDWGRWLIINLAFFIFLSICLMIPSLIIRRMSPVEILRFK